MEDVCILISFIDELFMVKHLQPPTIGGYLTGMKDAVLSRGIQSEALGQRGYRHPLVARALRSADIDTVTVPPSPPRELFTRPMLEWARVHWPVIYYAMAVLARGFLLRSGEFLLRGIKRGRHLIYWDNVVFYDKHHCEMPVEYWSTQQAASATIRPTSRKHQYRRVRPLAEVARVYYAPSGLLIDGLMRQEAKGCVVGALQGLFVLSGAAACILSETPLCYHMKGQLLTQEDMLQWCHYTGAMFGRPKVVIHSLKHAGVTAMIEAGISDEEVRMAAGFRSTDTVRTYDHPGQKAGPLIARALLLDASDSSDSEDEYRCEERREGHKGTMEHAAYRR
jgi:hypothetical protein